MKLSNSVFSLPTQAFDPDRLRARILEVKPGILAFNGKRSAQSFLDVSKVEYGPQATQLGSTALPRPEQPPHPPREPALGNPIDTGIV